MSSWTLTPPPPTPSLEVFHQPPPAAPVSPCHERLQPGRMGSSDPGFASVTRHKEHRKERVLLYVFMSLTTWSTPSAQLQPTRPTSPPHSPPRLETLRGSRSRCPPVDADREPRRFLPVPRLAIRRQIRAAAVCSASCTSAHLPPRLSPSASASASRTRKRTHLERLTGPFGAVGAAATSLLCRNS